jgi:hypothetical protein
MLLSNACTSAAVCPLRLQWFLVNPVTGALSAGRLGPSSTYDTGSFHISGDGRGHFAKAVRNSDVRWDLATYRVRVVNGVTAPYGVAAHLLQGKDAQGRPQVQGVNGPPLVTSVGTVGVPAGPVSGQDSNIPGWFTYSATSVSDGHLETLIGDVPEGGVVANHEIDSVAMGSRFAWLGEIDGKVADGCAIEGLRPNSPGTGLAHARTPVPCTAGSYHAIGSLFAQGGHVYAGVLGGGWYGFTEGSTPYLTPTQQKGSTTGGVVQAWTGFLYSAPTVTVPATASAKAGIPVTIRCSQTCSGSIKTVVRLAGTTPVTLHARAVPAHAAGAFTLTLVVPTALRARIAAWVKKKHAVTAIVTTSLVSGAHSVTVVRTTRLRA